MWPDLWDCNSECVLPCRVWAPTWAVVLADMSRVAGIVSVDGQGYVMGREDCNFHDIRWCGCDWYSRVASQNPVPFVEL